MDIFCRGIITGVYTTNSPEAVHHILESSNADIVIVDDAKQMEKIYAIKHKLPNLKAVIQTLPPYAPYVKRDDGYYRVRYYSPLFKIYIWQFGKIICNLSKNRI